MQFPAHIAETFTKLLADPKIQKAMDYLKQDHQHSIDEQKEIALIPGAPNTELEIRSPMMLRKIREYGLQDCSTDEVGNTFGYVRGQDANAPLVVLEGHLDTVFDMDVPLAITEKDGVIYCPGIGDDTAAIARILSVVRAIRHAGLEPCGTLMIGGTVGEEAPGMSRGIRHLMATRSDIDVYIAMETCWTHRITRGGVCCRRLELTFTGLGGHAWSAYGLASAINAAGYAIANIAGIVPPTDPKTIINIGLAQGGTSVNSIAGNCVLHVDIRSISEKERDSITEKIVEAAKAGVATENGQRDGKGDIRLAVRAYNEKPGGDQSIDADIVQIAAAATEAVGVEPNFMPASSTNINFPLAKGIPCVCIGAGGDGKNMHSLDESYEPQDCYTAAQKALLMLFACAGLKGVCEPVMKKLNA